MQEMNKEIKALSTSITKSLKGMRVEVAHSQVLNAVSAALGQTDWQTLRAKLAAVDAPVAQAQIEELLKVFCEHSAPMTLAHLRAQRWNVHCHVEGPKEWLVRDDSYRWAKASEMITGSRFMLKQEAFTLVSLPTDTSGVVFEVKGVVRDPEFWVRAQTAVLTGDASDPESAAFYAGNLCLVTFVPQADMRDYFEEIDGRDDVDVTVELLRLPLEKVQRLKDNDLSSDDLVDTVELGHSGPFYVLAEDSACGFFEVDNLSEITAGMLDAARLAHGVYVG